MRERLCPSLDLAASSLLFMSRKASQYVFFMAALVAVPGGSWGAPQGHADPIVEGR